jgi:hypothetical protein
MMVITHQSLSASYIINGDGSQRSDVQISSPDSSNDYAPHAQPAIVADKLHLFGGASTDYRKVSLFSSFQNLFFSRSLGLTTAKWSNWPQS